MKKHSRYEGGKRVRRLSAFLLGSCVGTIALGLLSAGAAAAGEKGLLPVQSLRSAGKLLYGLSLLLGAYLTARRTKKGSLPWAAGAGLWLFALSLCAARIAGSGLSGLWIPVALTPLGVLLGCLLGVRRRRSGCL